MCSQRVLDCGRRGYTPDGAFSLTNAAAQVTEEMSNPISPIEASAQYSDRRHMLSLVFPVET